MYQRIIFFFSYTFSFFSLHSSQTTFSSSNYTVNLPSQPFHTVHLRKIEKAVDEGADQTSGPFFELTAVPKELALMSSSEKMGRRMQGGSC